MGKDSVLRSTDRRLQGPKLIAARAMWLVAAGLVLALVVGTLPDILLEAGTVAPAGQRTFSQLSPAEARILADIGISVRVYAAFVLAWMLSPVVVFTLVAGVIFLRRADDAVAFLMSLMLLAIGIAVLYLAGITRFRPLWQTVVYFVRALGVQLLLLLLFLFPDGRFVPRWTRILAALWAGWMLYWLVFPRSPLGLLDFAGALTPVGLVLMVLGFGAGVFAQVYRYRRISSPLQRQQAKVFAFGFAAMLLLYVIAVSPFFLVPAVRVPGWPYLWYGLIFVPLLTRLAFALVPVVIGFAILRYRLWDIDLVIRRTLVYGALTGALALIYGVTVVSCQRLFSALTGQERSQLATMVSTLAIAALFGPLRSRVQGLVDRRFDRRKYDAARVLADFSRSVLDEVDVGRLTDQLVDVVDHALKPAHLSLWLSTSDPDRPDRAAASDRRPGPEGHSDGTHGARRAGQ